MPDIYRRRAQKEGFASRAVYKLQAMDKRYRLFSAGMQVLDLGCSPGSWLQYVAARVGPKGLVVGVDLNPPEIVLLPPLHFLAMDMLSLDLAAIKALSPSFDVVISDMAPRTTGVREVDQTRSLELAWRAFQLSQEVLKAGGHLLVKLFEGPDTPRLAAQVQESFRQCHRVKPQGSRQASREFYLLGLKKHTGQGHRQRA
jgi:23S rRNA (uridine2552-2'-O)-methyltransferase